MINLVCVLCGLAVTAGAQEITKNVPVKEGDRVEIVNLHGRVTARTHESQGENVDVNIGITVSATSTNGLTSSELAIASTGSNVSIKVQPAGPSKRVDLTITLPPKARLKIETGRGEVRIEGDILSADVRTDTGTISADVPTENIKYALSWTASRPRFLSDFELAPVKEKRAGRFEISGSYREKASVTTGSEQIDHDPADSEADPANGSRTKERANGRLGTAASALILNLQTARGIILLNVPPNEVMSDLRERPLTEAAKAIVRSGDSLLMDAIRRAAPRYYGDYTRSLPPFRSEPGFAERPLVERTRADGVKVATVRVSDVNNRSVAGLTRDDFEVLENGQLRELLDVRPTTAPFNLVLLLDVSGSVENYVDFIRKAARNFVETVDRRDRISIVTFNDDVSIVSGFTTDKTALSESLDTFDAGGATAYYDALAYTLADTLRPLKGERTAIVILTDGDDNRSFLPFDSMLSSIQESGALIYPLYVPSALIAASSDPNASIDTLRQRYLHGQLTSKAKDEGQRLAKVSGGVYYQIERLSQIQAAYEDIVKQLRSAYDIEYRSELGGVDQGISPRMRIRTKRPNSFVQVRSVVPK